MPCLCLNRCWSLDNKFRSDLNQNTYIFIEEHAFENVVWKMVAIIMVCTQCVKVTATCLIDGYPVLVQVNTLRPRQNDRHFADDTFNRIFVNENVRTSIEFSLKFVPKGPINNIPALVQIMAWRRPGDKPLSELVMVSLLTHICVTRPQWVKA